MSELHKESFGDCIHCGCALTVNDFPDKEPTGWRHHIDAACVVALQYALEFERERCAQIVERHGYRLTQECLDDGVAMMELAAMIREA